MDAGYFPLKTADIDDSDDDYPHSNPGKGTRRTERSSLRSRIALISGTLGLAIFLLVSCLRLPTFRLPSNNAASSGQADESPGPIPAPPSTSPLDPSPTLEKCIPPTPLPPRVPVPKNPWSSLSLSEISAVHAFLSSSSSNPNLNLTTRTNPALSDNTIFNIEIFYPPKEDALAYLDAEAANPKPDKVEAPERWARVTIHHGGEPEGPVIRDYLVGPITPQEPETKKGMTMKRLTDIYHNPDIPFNAGGITAFPEFARLLGRIAPQIEEALLDLFNGTARGHPNDTLICGVSGPFSYDGSFRRIWFNWRRNLPGPYLHPLNFFQYVDVSGTDPGQWKVLKVVYNWQMFNSVDAFMDAWKSGKLEKLPGDGGWKNRTRSDDDGEWTSRKRPKDVESWDLDDRPGPRSVSFKGLRFRVEKEEQYVSWMGWSFYLGFDRDMGLNLWDIRVQGERIIYQLAPQEALAQYAGNDPMQSTTAWLDRFFGMGSSVRDMIPAYDCPHEAVYLPAMTYSVLDHGVLKRNRAICIFEQNTGRPITRHTGYLDGEFGAVLGFALTVRSVATVGNYDYLFDYIFQLDGTLEVRVSASGYLQGGYWEPKQEGYGGRIHDTTMGNLHDHVINFKIDLDIAGTNNSLLRTTTSQETVSRPWFDDDWGDQVIQQKITKTYIDNENDALLEYPHNLQGGYAIVNREHKNRWGYDRGYAVHAGSNPIHNTVVGSKRLLHNANWARYNLAVSKRKETEPSSSSMWNMNLPGSPTVDFLRFFDGENLTQEDLVLWINVGTHHLPQAEDAPNTKTNIATSNFILTPLNYFDSDISLFSRNAIIMNVPIEPTEDSYVYDDYGVDQGYTCMPGIPEKLKYHAVERYMWGIDDDERILTQVGAESRSELMENAEMYHRIKVEL